MRASLHTGSQRQQRSTVYVSGIWKCCTVLRIGWAGLTGMRREGFWFHSSRSARHANSRRTCEEIWTEATESAADKAVFPNEDCVACCLPCTCTGWAARGRSRVDYLPAAPALRQPGQAAEIARGRRRRLTADRAGLPYW